MLSILLVLVGFMYYVLQSVTTTRRRTTTFQLLDRDARGEKVGLSILDVLSGRNYTSISNYTSLTLSTIIQACTNNYY